ncbi:MAG: hypothetical protein M3R24_02670 [Chloroflexota bacterium]|nr:hypothetical protein [Chloroflexota bacterium]PLS77861.1 MAG: hypothetical protein CYG59_21445 [Chloroflexota bacterium]
MAHADERSLTATRMFRWVVNLPFMLLWNVGYFVVRLLIVLRHFMSVGLILILLVIVPLLLFLLPRLDRIGGYVLIAGAVALAFIAGTLSRQR